MLLYGIVTVVILILDQLLKSWTVQNIALNTGTHALVPGVLHLTYIQNQGVAFGFGADKPWFRWLMVIVALAFAVVILTVLAKKKVQGALGRWAAVLVMAGALGNCIDRVIRGYVVDMIQLEFVNFQIFNLADSCLTVGAILFCLYIIFHKPPVRAVGGADQLSPNTPRENSQLHGGDVEQISRPSLDEMTDRLPRIGVLKAAQERAERAGQGYAPVRPRPVQQQPMPNQGQDQYARRMERQDPRSGESQAPEAEARPNQAPRRRSDQDFSLDDILDEFRE